MSFTTFKQILTSSDYILGEGAVIERLRRDTPFELDEMVVNSAFIYEEKKRQALSKIIRQYIDIGKRYDIPLLLSTPTWRANKERIDNAGFGDNDVNGDNFRFLESLKNSYGAYSQKIFICGLMSCRGDAYKPEEALSVKDAATFHAWQAQQLAKTSVDFILGATLPALSEAQGLASALAQTKKPYVLSFVLRPEGTLLDGTPIKECIETIDREISPSPFAYMANCTHSSTFQKAFQPSFNISDSTKKHIIGLLANTSSLTPEELNENVTLQEEKPELFGRRLAAISSDFGVKILGGCCGTDNRHIEELARQLTIK